MKTLEDIFEDYAFDKMKDNGLVLFPLPTGSGKSFTIFNFICKMLTEKKIKDKIIFVTSLKKNLQLEELAEHFDNPHKEIIFKDKVLFVKSNLDCVLDNLQDLDSKIPAAIKDLKEYRFLYQAVCFCKTQEKNTDFQVQEAVKQRKDDIRDNIERTFRRKIKALLDVDIKAKFGRRVSYKYKLKFVQENKKWTWLLGLYPQILTREKQVYLMSMDKFLLRNDPIIDKPYFIYKKLIAGAKGEPGAIVFIDEFDATKDTILNRLVDEATHTQIDYITAYKIIHDRLAQGEFPADMLVPSKQQIESRSRGYGKEKLEEVIPNWIKRSDEIYERFNMQYNFKNIETESEDLAFLFQDIHSVTISNKKDSRWIAFKKDDKKKINSIYYPSQKDPENKDFKYMVKDVRGFLKFFCGGVQILAINLMQCKNENNEEDFTYEDGISSILDNFFPGDSNNRIRQYFMEEILLYHKNKEETHQQIFDGSFLENGYSYYAIEDDNGHSLRSAILMTTLDSTPEKILVEICKRARVFGISATANYDTLLGNYALYNYVIPKLKTKYFVLTEEENEVLKQHFEKSICCYDKVKIHVNEISCNTQYCEEAWKDVFESPDDRETAYATVMQAIGNTADKNDYLKTRYLRLAKVFKTFIENDRISSYLCLLTTFPEKNKPEMDKEALATIYNLIAKGKSNFNSNVQILKGNNYDKKKDEIQKKLTAGNRILVISTYQTVGAGQNLQYEIPKEQVDKVIQINNFKKSDKKDFDALYLDKPTMLMTLLGESSEPKDFAKYLAQIEYLKASGEITHSNSRRLIGEAFKHYFYKERLNLLKSTEIASYSSYATKVLVQAVGRICRTNNKNSDIFIFYDSAISDLLSEDSCMNNLLNPEFAELLKHAGKPIQIDQKTLKLKNLAETKSNEAHTRIIKYVSDGRNGWIDKAIEEWKAIRYFVLRHPTLTTEEYNTCEDLYKPFYIELPEANNKVWFKKSDDFKDVTISFVPQNGYESVSEEDARLPQFFKIPEVERCFEQEKFVKEFKKAKYIMCPPVFTNIYKGALGEYAGKVILDSFKMELEEIKENDFFELFDYKIKNSNVYVDFKHWNEYAKYTFIPRDQKYMTHVYEKMEKCGGKHALIINVFAENDYKMPHHSKDGMQITEIPFLYDLKTMQANKKAFETIYNVWKES